ncbi:MAG: hypothetical protein IJQ67_00265 [Bacilli bacterium]|nr:hypothetical protein [Bacilli bacterium]
MEDEKFNDSLDEKTPSSHKSTRYVPIGNKKNKHGGGFRGTPPIRAKKNDEGENEEMIEEKELLEKVEEVVKKENKEEVALEGDTPKEAEASEFDDEPISIIGGGEEEKAEEVKAEEETPKEETKVEAEEETKEETASEEEPKVEEEVKEQPKKVAKDVYTDVYPRPEPRMPRPDGLDVTFFSEGMKIFEPTGQTLYTGDDALPFVSNNVLLVADGLGGTSCGRHTKFDRGIFEEDLVFETLFEDMYGRKEANPLLNDYVIDSFGVVISYRNLYDDKANFSYNINFLKKSGHFGSRVASATLLHQLIDQKVVEEVYGMFDNVRAAEESNDLEAKDNCVKEMAGKIEKTFKEEFIHAANKAGFINESRNPKMDILGTTMCATVLRENEEDVEALYLFAGDSLPFLLNLDGLCEVMKAHEGTDGGMTNRIRSNDAEVVEFMKNAGRPIKEFYLEPKYMRFKKPCILFNASDGVFDCFTNPLFMEKTILTIMADSTDARNFADNIKKYFDINNHIDDSATMAAKFFGFNDYEEVKDYAKERLCAIEKEYVNAENGGLPEFFDADYNILLNNKLSKERDGLNKLFYTLNVNPKVTEYYSNAVAKRERNINTFNGNIAFLDKQIEFISQELEYHEKNISFKVVEGSEKISNLAKFEEEVRTALNNELTAFKRYREKEAEALEKYQAVPFYKTFREEWTAKSVRVVETLIAHGIFTKEEINELLDRFDVSLDDTPDKEVQRLQELALKQKELVDKYMISYNRLTAK